MSFPVTTPLFSVVWDAVFTARVVVVVARIGARFRLCMDEVEVLVVIVDVVIVAALACISSVWLAREREKTTREGVTTTTKRSRGVDRDRIASGPSQSSTRRPIPRRRRRGWIRDGPCEGLVSSHDQWMGTPHGPRHGGCRRGVFFWGGVKDES